MIAGTLITLLPDRKGAYATTQMSLGEAANFEETSHV
jgi:hypothetical protein